MCRLLQRRKRRKEAMRLSDVDLDRLVKIQGTQYDRKRRVNDKERAEMRRLYFSGQTVAAISKLTGFGQTTVRYNVDDDWRAWFNATRSGDHTGTDTMTFSDRVKYKRDLVRKRIIRV